MNVETLYNMAKAAARGAERVCEAVSEGKFAWQIYGGYPAYIAEYNKLLPFVIEEYGAEAEYLFQPIDLGKSINPADVPGMMWRTYAELAAARLAALASYLQDKVGEKTIQIQSILDVINLNLRPAIFDKPKREREIQNSLEIILRAKGFDYQREKVSIVYSSKTYVPDFTFDSRDLALEVKFCNTVRKEKDIIDEINGDIPAYKTKYRHLIFVVYDLGFIRDVMQFKSGIEDNPDVYVLVVKR